VNTAMVL